MRALIVTIETMINTFVWYNLELAELFSLVDTTGGHSIPVRDLRKSLISHGGASGMKQ